MIQKLIYISPSQQHWNKCILGDTEQQHMFEIAKELKQYLDKDSRFKVKLASFLSTGNESQVLISTVNESNFFLGSNGLHLAIHSDGGYLGSGCSVFYFDENSPGKKFAKIMYNKISKLTPWIDSKCCARANLYELKRTNSSAILIEVSFHDQKIQAKFIHERKKEIAQTIYLGLCDIYCFDPVVSIKSIEEINKECTIDEIKWNSNIMDIEIKYPDIKKYIQKIYYHNKNLN